MAKLKLNDEFIEKAEKLIAAGNYNNAVCAYLGIAEKTWYEWTNQGNEDIENKRDTIFSKFCKSIKKAEATAEMRNVTIIQNAAKNTWQAAAWYLERKHKDRWSGKQEIESKNTNDNTVHIKLEGDLQEWAK